MIDTATIPGAVSGRMTDHRVQNGPQPSICAASSILAGDGAEESVQEPHRDGGQQEPFDESEADDGVHETRRAHEDEQRDDRDDRRRHVGGDDEPQRLLAAGAQSRHREVGGDRHGERDEHRDQRSADRVAQVGQDRPVLEGRHPVLDRETRREDAGGEDVVEALERHADHVEHGHHRDAIATAITTHFRAVTTREG